MRRSTVGEGSLRWRGRVRPSVCLERTRVGSTWPRWTGLGTRQEPNVMSFSPNHEIVFGAEKFRQECYNVRINVFHHEQGFPLEAEIDKLRLIWPRRRRRPL